MNELAIEVGKAKERLKGLDGRWFRPVQDSSHLGLIHRKSFWRYHIAKVIDGIGMEHTF